MSTIFDGIYQEFDGLHYFEAPPGVGCYSSPGLRRIADRLDELNAPIQKQLEAASAPEPAINKWEALKVALRVLESESRIKSLNPKCSNFGCGVWTGRELTCEKILRLMEEMEVK